jgi:hypothetical protein
MPNRRRAGERCLMDIFSAQKLSDALRPKAEGEPVNVHVVSRPRELGPDFDAMQKTILGDCRNDTGNPCSEERKVPERK